MFRLHCVDLFSNAPSGTTLVNEPHNFRNPLPQDVDLTGWEVSVQEISLPTTWQVPLQPFQWIGERHPLTRTDLDTQADRRIHGATPFDNYASFQLDNYVKWAGEEGIRLLFTLKRGTYETGEDVIYQMLKQMKEVHAHTFSDLTLIKNHLGRGAIKKYVGPQTMDPSVAIYVNQALERVLQFADRDPVGALYKRYALLRGTSKHGDSYPQGVFVLSWRTYFEPKDIEMLAGERALFRSITHTHRSSPNYQEIHAQDGFRVTKLYYSANNPSLHYVAAKAHRGQHDVPDTSYQVNRFYLYSDFTETKIIDKQRKSLLASIANPGPQDKYTTYYQHLLNMPYVPTKAGTRNYLQVWIEDEMGNPVIFKNGTSRVQLHFRPRHL